LHGETVLPVLEFLAGIGILEEGAKRGLRVKSPPKLEDIGMRGAAKKIGGS
jgi:hypothetical protein